MRYISFVLLALGLASASLAADIDIYTAADLQHLAQSLSVKQGASYADRNLARHNNHHLLLVKREATGSSELHQREADIFVVESGQAAILTGGKMVDGHTTAPGEIRGKSIEGGERHSLAAGDIIHIPAGTPHQVIIENSKPFTYFVVKVSGQ
ncbi:MAG: cupin domain-containing protein [Acidobacteriota bacterium]|nr:cupin domain-containing protein [Acidobacteriota bacterium]